MNHPIIIIGTGLSGYQLAREYRKLDQTSPLVLITESDGRFYPKPQLSTALTNKKTSDSLATANAESMMKQLNATIKTKTKVTTINPESQTIQANDETLNYSKLILALGATVIDPNLKGNAVSDVLSINHLEDYAVFEKTLQNKKNIAILGAGLIGCEFANDLSNAGFKVEVIDLANSAISLLLPNNIGKLLQEALEKNGVHFNFECKAEEINKTGKHYELILSHQKKLNSDLVISAIGLRPNLTLAKAANIETARGIIVNRYLETNQKNIYALGDCAEVEGHVLPYIAPILNAARALAKTLAGQKTAVEYPAMPVIIKTPAHPIVVCPPPRHMQGNWQIETANNNTKALFYNDNYELYGFILTNEFVKERMALVTQLPKLI